MKRNSSNSEVFLLVEHPVEFVHIQDLTILELGESEHCDDVEFLWSPGNPKSECMDVCNRVRGLCIVEIYISQTSALSRCSQRLWPLSSCPSLYYNKGGNFDVNPLTSSRPLEIFKRCLLENLNFHIKGVKTRCMVYQGNLSFLMFNYGLCGKHFIKKTSGRFVLYPVSNSL